LAIKNKDGSVYRLNGPNPVMTGQALWKDFKKHNFKYDIESTVPASRKKRFENQNKIEKLNIGESSNYKAPPIKKDEFFSDEKPTKKEKVIPRVPEIPVEIKHAEEVRLIDFPPPVEDTNEPKQVLVDDDVVLVKAYVLPCTTKTVYDKLYDEKIVKVSYGDKIETKVAPLSYEDNGANFWHPTKFPEGTIIYPSNNQKMWWQVEVSVPYKNGFIMKCIPSDKNPNFN
jgi:hypothetical protein